MKSAGLYILLKLGTETYALAGAQVMRIIPGVHLRKLPQAHPGVAGLLNYRRSAVPVVDLCALALGRPASPRLSSRIVLVNYPAAADATRLLGLLAEAVTETLSLDAKEWQPPGITVPDAPYLDRVATTQWGMVQLAAFGFGHQRPARPEPARNRFS